MKLLSNVTWGWSARTLFIAVGLSSFGAVGLAAQDAAAAEHGPWLVGGSIGMPVANGSPLPELITIGAHWTQFRPGQLGADFWLGTIPRTLPEGIVTVGARGGVALPFALASGLYLVPSAGLTLLGGVSSGGAGGEAGANAGIAAKISSKSSSVGLRVGVTGHRFLRVGGMVWLWEIGLGRRP